jgi:mannose-1-phosphate guanylyltransferase
MNWSQSVTPVILSGGSGTRLWPLSRSLRPKQFMSLTPGGTMLELTLARTASEGQFARPVIVSNTDHAPLIEQQCGAIERIVILEPMARNTAPAIALAALSVAPDSLMLVSPSDHVIADVAAFHAAIAAAVPLASDGWLVTFGINPTGPETGYGYIRRTEAVSDGAFKVERFVEKPSVSVAQGYIDEGCYSWNAGIFLFRADAYLAALQEFAPAMLVAARAAMDKAQRDRSTILPDAAAFATSPADSIDYAVMEKAERVAVVPVDMGWSDIGSWDALYDLLDKDAGGNVHVGDVTSLDSGGCLIRSDGPVVTVAGVQDLIVIASHDAVMILPRGASQDVKKIVDALKQSDHPTLKQ